MDANSRANKKTVVEFHNLVINRKDFESAKKYVANCFKQHKPYVPGGEEGLRVFIEYLRTEFPDAHSVIKKIIVEGDYVVLYVQLLRTLNRSRRFVEIFRLEKGKINGHWAIA